MSKVRMKMLKHTLLMMLFTSAAHSADFDNCKVVEIVTAGSNNAHIGVDCQITPRPTCAVGNYFGFDKSTDEGKMYMSIALTAFASGASITGYVDDNSCLPFQPNVAQLQHLRLKK
jgi:hypothetical protein